MIFLDPMLSLSIVGFQSPMVIYGVLIHFSPRSMLAHLGGSQAQRSYMPWAWLHSSKLTISSIEKGQLGLIK